MLSIVIPVYRNEESLPDLLNALSATVAEIAREHSTACEVVLVVDGSPDASEAILRSRLPEMPFRSKLLVHSRNFGSFAAIRTGLQGGTGQWFAAISADLQEPPDLLVSFLAILESGAADVVVGERRSRDDPRLARTAAWVFWHLYRRFVIHEMPPGGVDVFACTREVRDQLLSLREAHSSLVGQLFWIGFRRRAVPYSRRRRAHGKSAWTVARKVRYMLDSVYSFTDLPIRLLLWGGMAGMVLAFVLGCLVGLARVIGRIAVPGYAAIVIAVLFFGGLNALGLGVVGHYAWRTFENTKGRPGSIVSAHFEFDGSRDGSEGGE